jgi:hypothetical protein
MIKMLIALACSGIMGATAFYLTTEFVRRATAPNHGTASPVGKPGHTADPHDDMFINRLLRSLEARS